MSIDQTALRAARDAAIACVRAFDDAFLAFSRLRPKVLSGKPDAFRQAVALFDKLAAVEKSAKAAYTAEVSDFLATANATAGNLPGYKAFGTEFLSAHSVALEAITRWTRIPGIVDAMRHETADEYWKDFVAEVRECVLMPSQPAWNPDCHAIEVGIRREWANASALIAATGGEARSTVTQAVRPTKSPKLSPRELADKHGVPLGSLRKRLDRWRFEHDAGYCEVSNAARNEPKYLYDEAAVMPVVEDLTARSTGQKRATDGQQKKN